MLAAFGDAAAFVRGAREVVGAGMVPDAAEIGLAAGQARDGVIGRLGSGQDCEEYCDWRAPRISEGP